MSRRIAVFIDAGYFKKIIENEFGGAKIDYGLLSAVVAGSIPHFRTYYYDCLPYQDNPPTADQRARVANAQKFFYALNRIDRFEVREGRLAKSGGSFTQKGVDVLLAIDLV